MKKKRPLPAVEVFSTTEAGVSPVSIKRLAEHVLKEEGAKGIRRVSVILVNNREIRELNSRFLKKNRPTDVMSFPLDGPDGRTGEVYASVDMAKDQAVRFAVSLGEELSRLVIHGILHLLGYDDRHPNPRKIMKAREEHHLRTGPLARIKAKSNM